MGQILSQPVTQKHSGEAESARRAYGTSSMQGWRISMEDSHTAALKLTEKYGDSLSFFAVFDGHGGEQTAKQAGTQIVEHLEKTIESYDRRWGAALTDSFLNFDQELLAHMESVDSSGCAATAVLITDDEIVCANAGDSRTVLGRLGTAKPLSFDHKPENEGERSRIFAAGGFVEMGRVNANLALSRALGDFSFKNNPDLPPEEQVVTANPDIIEHKLDGDDEFVVLACDGIWDCMTSQEVVEFVRRGIADQLSLQDICELLLDNCLAPESNMTGIGCDNMTVCIVALLQKGQTFKQWYEMVANRVKEGKGRCLERSTEETRRQINERHARGLPSGDYEGQPDDEDLPFQQNSNLVQRVFGDAVNGDVDAPYLLSRMGVHFNVEEAEHEHAERA